MKFLLQDMSIEKSIFDAVHFYNGKKFTTPIIDFNSILYPLKNYAIAHGDLPFIIEVMQGKEKRIVSYKTFYTTLLKVGHILKNTHKVKLHTKVSILPANTLDSIYIILGVILCGGIAVIINPNEPIERITQQIEKVDSSLTIIDFTNQSSNINWKTTTQDIVKESNNLIHSPNDIEFHFNSYQPALIIFTTGTTSASKAVVQMHYSIAVNCHALVSSHQLDSKQRLLCTLPIYHVNGLEFTIFSSMIAGSCVVLCDNFDPFIYLELIDKYKITIASLVPTMLDHLINENSQRFDLSSLRYFATAAAPLSRKTSNLIWEKFSKRIIQGYGLTETMNFSTLLPTTLNEDAYKYLMLDCDIPSAGQEVFGNEVAILKSNGAVVNEGEEGEICMRGHNIMAGYLHNSAANKECFKGGWFHSGDIGKFICLPFMKQRFLKITGRIKNIIKVNGHAVSLDEIDRLILNIEGVRDSITCAINDDIVGELPLSFVVRGNDSLTEIHIINVIAKSINYQSLPRTIIFVSNIPRMKNGKVNRSLVLKELLKNI